jgi:hypothetical protein
MEAELLMMYVMPTGLDEILSSLNQCNLAYSKLIMHFPFAVVKDRSGGAACPFLTVFEATDRQLTRAVEQQQICKQVWCSKEVTNYECKSD